MKVLVAVPVFNEEKYVSPVLREIRKYTRASGLNDIAMNTRVLVIDDGSTDNTPAVVQDLAQRGHIDLITHQQNKGYGQSLIDAFVFASDNQYDWVITMDCDEQHEPCQIPLFVREVRKNDADIISGSRYLKVDADGIPPEDRRNINRLVTELLNTSLHLKMEGGEERAGGPAITDAFCGFKAHRVSAMSQLQLSIPGYAFPMQFWVQADAKHLRIREIPVKLIYKDATRHFGGALDDPAVRLQHYLEVFATETKRVREHAAGTGGDGGTVESATVQTECAVCCDE